MAAVSLPPKRKRRWFQYSLSTLGVLVTWLCVALAWLAYERGQVRKRKAAIEAIESFGGLIVFNEKKPFRPTWLRPLLADDMAGEVSAVDLGRTQVTAADLVHLAGLTNLTDLNLGYAPVTDAGLAHLAGLNNLEELCLYHTQVTDAGLVHLAGLTNLTDLNLQGTQVTDAGLVDLKGLENLKVLWLYHTQVTDAGAAELQKALPKLNIIR